mmetsp:Transcript_17127/g.40886  ORF Transcript_17127/g.40886 Transcript_17127/m.40886 type:complete len:379 (+) Transcript_17127:738-1874(+)
MMCGLASTPERAAATAASKIAVACMCVMSGCTMPRRHPRSPSIGLASSSASMRVRTSADPTPSSDASWSHSWSSAGPSCGRNSCSGGSSRRIVTGSPSIAAKMPSKSSRWKPWISRSASALPGAPSSCAAIMRRTAAMRSFEEKNMCSVRTSPTPVAPFLRATSQSSGVSALAYTSIDRNRSTHSMNLPTSPDSTVGGTSSFFPRTTSPVVPLSDTQSPSRNTSPVDRTVTVLDATSTCSASHPHTHGLPQPRATTAAWDVIPPRLVRMPAAAHIPPTSSGVVSGRVSSTDSPLDAHSSASVALNTTRPTAAPGDALSPFATTSPWYAFGSLNCGCSSWSRWLGSTIITAWAHVISRSRCRSTAIFRAARPVRLPLRV